MATKKATKDLIKAGSIARVTSKATGKFLGFAVKSNSNNDYYQVTCTKIAGECVYSCTCPAKNYGHADCCHCQAVRELVAARKARIQAQKQAEQGEAQAAVNEAERIVNTPLRQFEDWGECDNELRRSFPGNWKDRMEQAPLTSNSGFHFLR